MLSFIYIIFCKTILYKKNGQKLEKTLLPQTQALNKKSARGDLNHFICCYYVLIVTSPHFHSNMLFPDEAIAVNTFLFLLFFQFIQYVFLVNFFLDQNFPKTIMPFRIIMNEDQMEPLGLTTKGMRFNRLQQIAHPNEFTEIFFGPLV